MKGNPHLTSGFRKNPRGGHTWIWDGIRGYVNGSSIEVDEYIVIGSGTILVALILWSI